MTHPPITITLPGIPPHRLLHVPGGEFLMGSADDDPDARDNEKPAHRVRLDDFFIGEFLVTQDLWKAVMGENPSQFEGLPRQPVILISWSDIAQKFLPRLRKLTEKVFRLPTEAEWEYAARGGPFAFHIGEGRGGAEDYRYAGSDRLEQVGWYKENSGGASRDVGLLLPNALGLYDMSGNVWEWCADVWHDNYIGAPTDGSAWVDSQGGVRRLVRGGSIGSGPQLCRPASRGLNVPSTRNFYLGFRLVSSL